MKRVYILSVYREDGAEEVTATLDPLRLPRMAGRYLKSDAELAIVVTKIEEAVATGEAYSLAGENLQRGWGGLQLHIVDLDESEEAN